MWLSITLNDAAGVVVGVDGIVWRNGMASVDDPTTVDTEEGIGKSLNYIWGMLDDRWNGLHEVLAGLHPAIDTNTACSRKLILS